MRYSRFTVIRVLTCTWGKNDEVIDLRRVNLNWLGYRQNDLDYHQPIAKSMTIAFLHTPRFVDIRSDLVTAYLGTSRLLRLPPLYLCAGLIAAFSGMPRARCPPIIPRRYNNLFGFYRRRRPLKAVQ